MRLTNSESELLDEILDQPCELEDRPRGEYGHGRHIGRRSIEVILRKIVEQACMGDRWSQGKILELKVPKAPLQVEHTSMRLGIDAQLENMSVQELQEYVAGMGSLIVPAKQLTTPKQLGEDVLPEAI